MGKVRIAALLGSLLIAATLVPLLAPKSDSLTVSAVHLPRQHLDLGQVAQDEQHDLVSNVENRGTRRLVINQINTDCGCGEPIAESILILPGETGQLWVHFETQSATGLIRRAVQYTTNDPCCPRFELLITASVDSSPSRVASQ